MKNDIKTSTGTKNEQEIWVALHKPTTRWMRETNQATGHKDKSFITFQLGSISAYFFLCYEKYYLGRWEEQLPSGYWPIHKIKLLQLSSLFICVIYYLNRSCFAQVRMLCITLDIHICTEPWSFTPWYIFLAAWNKGMNMNECEWILMNINNPITNPILWLAFLLVNFRKFHGNGFWHKSTDTYPFRNFSARTAPRV